MPIQSDMRELFPQGESDPEQAGLPAGSAASMKVLLVDDDADDLMLVRDLIEANGGNIRCDTAGGFEEGLEVIGEGLHDAYLIDYRLGARTGLDLIRETAPLASGPMVLLTGMGSESIDRGALSSGAADYMPKSGLTTETVQRSIRYAVETWRARRAAEEGKARYRSLFDGVPVGLFRIGRDGRLIEVNRTMVELLGYPDKDSLVGELAGGLFDENDEHLLDPLAPGGGTEQIDVEVRLNGGASRWVTLTTQVVTDPSGTISHIEGAMSDITARKAAEAEAALRGRLLDEVPSAVIVTDLEGRCTYWNRFAETMYGWSAAEAVGRDISELTVIAEERNVAEEIMAEIAHTGHWEGEFKVARRDGSTFPAQVSDSLLLGDDGYPTGIIGVSMDVTARKEAESALREYEELHTKAFDASPIGKAIVSVPDGKLISVNTALCDFLGYTSEELSGMTFADITHSEDIQTDLDEYEKLASGEIDSYSMDKRYVRSDGEVVWGQMRGSLIRASDGTIRFGLGQVVDINDRKKAEERISFQASLLDQVHHAVLATDMSGSVTYWNKQAEAMYGWAADEILGRNLFAMTLPEPDAAVTEMVVNALTDHGVWEGEVELLHKDGSVFQAWASDTLLRDSDGTPSGVVGVKVDLTELKQAKARARTQEILNRSLLESVEVPIGIVDADGHIVASNPSWDALIDGSDDNAPAYLPASISVDPSMERDVIVERIRQVWEGMAEEYNLEYMVRRGTEERWMRLAALPIKDMGSVIAHWDITDERFARQALEETIRMKDEFIAGISHELRTPLSVVAGLAELLRSEVHGRAELTEFHNLIADQAQEMALIVEDLLTAGRIDSDTLTIRPEDLDLSSEVEKVLLPWKRDDRTIVGTELDAGLRAFADPLRVRQIVRNLVSNALKYGRSPVLVKGIREGSHSILQVIDHGKGVPEWASDRVFDQYVNFATAEGQPSSVGLGLHVARRLARIMSGDLTYRRDGPATVFELVLPNNGQGP